MRDSGTAILAEVRVGTDTATFVVDTGSSVTILGERFRSALGKPVDSATLSAASSDLETSELYASPRLELASSPAVLDFVACKDLRMISCIIGESIDGILGIVFLARNVVTLDFPNHRIGLSKDLPEGSVGDSEKLPLHQLPGRRFSTTVHMSSAGEFEALIDSGDNGALTLTELLWGKLPAGKDSEVAAVNSSDINGNTARLDLRRVAELQLGGLRFHRLLAVKTRNPFAPAAIGLPMLRRICPTIDFANRSIYLRRDRDADRTDEADMSGTHLLRQGGDTIVHSVDSSSPAEIAGILPGDILRTIGGRPAAELSLNDAREAFKAGDGKRVGVELDRRGRHIRCDLILRKKL
jgi:hypothetical protein